MSDWRDISTAPKDFTPVLAWDGAQAAVVAYDPRKKEWLLLEGNNEAHPESPIKWVGSTHWKHLEPPKQLDATTAAHLNRQPSDDLGLPSDSEASS